MTDLASTEVVIIHLGRREWMNSNQRLHWRERSRRSSFIRSSVEALARGIGPYEKVHILAVVRYPKGVGAADPANSYPTVKAAIDGLVDAGLIANDDHHHVIGPDMRRGDNTDARGLWSIELHITELENHAGIH